MKNAVGQADYGRRRPARAWVRGALPSVVAAITVQAAHIVAVILQLAVAADVVGQLISGQTPMLAVLIVPLVLLGVLGLIRLGLAWWGEVLAVRAETRAYVHLRCRLYRAILKAGPGPSALDEAAQRAVLMEGAHAVARYFTRFVPAGLVAVVAVLAVTGLLAWDHPVTAAIAFTGLVASQILPLLWLRLVGGPSIATINDLAHSNRVFVDNVRGLPTAKAFNAVAARRRIMEQDAEQLRQHSMSVLWLGLSWSGLAQFLTMATTVIATMVGCELWRTGHASARTALLPLLILPVGFAALARFGGNRHAAMDAQQAGGPMGHILEGDHLAAEKGAMYEVPFGDVVLDQVSFTYPGRVVPAVDDIKLTVGAGSLIAIVGSSGAGKSTIGSLLLRFVRPTSGSVTIGGIDVSRVTADALYRQVGLIAQDTYLFHGTVRDNLMIARPEATNPELLAALAKAGLSEFLDSLPSGLDTPIGERGNLLSGGQRQRLSIARALLSGARVLILDEATAGLDGRSEQAVLDTVAALTPERTVIMIAHRLSVARNADCIVVMEEGRITQVGSHAELASECGRYAALMGSQVRA